MFSRVALGPGCNGCGPSFSAVSIAGRLPVGVTLSSGPTSWATTPEAEVVVRRPALERCGYTVKWHAGLKRGKATGTGTATWRLPRLLFHLGFERLEPRPDAILSLKVKAR